MTSLDTLSTDIEEGPPEEKGRLDVRVKPSTVLRLVLKNLSTNLFVRFLGSSPSHGSYKEYF